MNDNGTAVDAAAARRKRSKNLAMAGLLCYLVSTLLSLPSLLTKYTLPAAIADQILTYGIPAVCCAILGAIVAVCMFSLKRWWFRAFATFFLVCGILELGSTAFSMFVFRPMASRILEQHPFPGPAQKDRYP